jgi:predicted esterase
MPDADPSPHHLRTPRTARYYTLGPAAASERWVVLHGYGQQARRFLTSFQALDDGTRHLVAPEALSRFYVDGMDAHNTVGASWMTKADREHEIADYVAYLDACAAAQPEAATLHVLGFSQGAATASRWALLGDAAVDRLTLWGGGPAHDLDLAEYAGALRALGLTLVVGHDDPYVSDKRLAQAQQRLDAHEIPVDVLRFEGGHRIDDATLRRLAKSQKRGETR